MARKCDISGKGGQFGNRVSHAKNRTKHLFKPNLQTRRLFVTDGALAPADVTSGAPADDESGDKIAAKPAGRFVRVKVSTRVMRTIDKIGVRATLKKYGLELKDIIA